MSMEKPEHLDQLREWLLSYKPEELFNEDGSVKQEIVDMALREMLVWVLTHMQTVVFF